MAKRQPKSTFVEIQSREGQITAPGGQLANYFLRNLPLWNPPSWQTAQAWRTFVEKQPIAAICRDAIANRLNSLDWAIVARDSTQRDELKLKIKHYTKLFERGNAYYYDIDFSSHIEWIIKDLFTLPFGAASEIGRMNDDPKGKVVWIRPLDGGTLSPTLNFDYPLVQVAEGTGLQPVYLPRGFFSRVFLSPRTEIRREGWGYAPPERIYLAIEMLYNGDRYYAQLLLNTPEAGVLDLGDMEKTTALEWVNNLRDLLYGVSPLKIPVLYEHTTKAEWIPFGKPPSEILYDSTTLKYAAILCAGYGITLSDIGMPSSGSGGETLAGTIRMERVGKSSGISTAKKKTAAYFNQILPEELAFQWIDYDDERNVAKGRARLASAQASQIWIDKRVFTPNEVRMQNIADGLISISVPETIDPNSDEFPQAQVSNAGGGSRPQSLGEPKAPSQGGQGEIIPQQTIQRNMAKAEVGVVKAAYSASTVMSDLIKAVSSRLNENEIALWEQAFDEHVIGKSDIEEESLKEVIDSIFNITKSVIGTQGWIVEFSEIIADKLIQDATMKQLALAELNAEDGDDLPEVNLSNLREEVGSYVLENMIDTVSREVVLIAKSCILSADLNIDSTETVDNNISISRETGRKFIQNVSASIHSVAESGRKYIETKLGEQDAIS